MVTFVDGAAFPPEEVSAGGANNAASDAGGTSTAPTGTGFVARRAGAAVAGGTAALVEFAGLGGLVGSAGFAGSAANTSAPKANQAVIMTMATRFGLPGRSSKNSE